MDPLDKLELIVKDKIKEKTEFERGKGKHNPTYLQGLQDEIDALSWVWTEIDAIKRNGPSVTDEVMEKIKERREG